MYHSQTAGIFTAFWLAQIFLRIWTHTNDGNHLHLSSCSYALFAGSGNLTDTGDLSSCFSMSSAPPGTAAALSSPWQLSTELSAAHSAHSHQVHRPLPVYQQCANMTCPALFRQSCPNVPGSKEERNSPSAARLTSWHHDGVLWGGLEGLGHTQVGSRDKIILPKTSLFSLSQ